MQQQAWSNQKIGELPRMADGEVHQIGMQQQAQTVIAMSFAPRGSSPHAWQVWGSGPTDGQVSCSPCSSTGRAPTCLPLGAHLGKDLPLLDTAHFAIQSLKKLGRGSASLPSKSQVKSAGSSPCHLAVLVSWAGLSAYLGRWLR